jgi:hypothetical protein
VKEDGGDAAAQAARRAEQLAEMRRFADATGSKLAVWQALHAHLGGQAAYEAYDPALVPSDKMVEIPAWCAHYLLVCAININELAEKYFLHHRRIEGGLSLPAVLEVLPRAMELSGPGWNGFKRMVSAWESLEDWRIFRSAKERGLTSTEAVEEVRQFRNLGSGPKDHRATARRISNGRKLDEALTKPHP